MVAPGGDGGDCGARHERCSVVGMMISVLLLVVILMLVLGTFPRWTYSRGWGYFPTGTFGTLLVVVLVLMVMGRI